MSSDRAEGYVPFLLVHFTGHGGDNNTGGGVLWVFILGQEFRKEFEGKTMVRGLNKIPFDA